MHEVKLNIESELKCWEIKIITSNKSTNVCNFNTVDSA